MTWSDEDDGDALMTVPRGFAGELVFASLTDTETLVMAKPLRTGAPFLGQECFVAWVWLTERVFEPDFQASGDLGLDDLAVPDGAVASGLSPRMRGNRAAGEDLVRPVRSISTHGGL